MSMTTHIAELERKHQALDRKITEEQSHAHKDNVKIAALKRKKLVLKDEILKLRVSGAKNSPQLH